MILSGREIARQVEAGNIQIDPYEPAHLNPVSLDLRLGTTVGRYTGERLSSKMPNQYETEEFDRWVVQPGEIYLMHTVETIWTDRFVPIIDGKSSLGRLGVVIHATAGFGDPGYRGQYTLEVATLGRPVTLHAGMRIAQIRFHTIEGEVELYDGNYKNKTSRGPVASRSWRQFETKE